jgi:hypothetical protein
MLALSPIRRLRLQIAMGLAILGTTGITKAAEPTADNVSRVIKPGPLPYRVHVFEDFETTIEKKWWLRAQPVVKGLPKSLSSRPNGRAAAAVSSKDFDRKMGSQTKSYKAVIFNPVPGPPMGKQTRLAFRYRLEGTDTLRVQIYSLSKNYHRHLILKDLPQGKWQAATVDMTDARRPDGSGGPLAEDERIDDIQFYVAPNAKLMIDDIILYDAATKKEKRPFPRRVIFTGWFDTGKQGQEWPGDFKIVLHEKPLTWDAAESVTNSKTGKPWIRVNLRGQRELSPQTHVRFRYRITGGKGMQVVLANSKTSQRFVQSLATPSTDRWLEATVKYEVPQEKTGPVLVDDIRFLIDEGAQLQIDDVLIFEPGTTNR